VSAEIFSTSVRLGLDPMKAQLIRPAVDPHFFSPMASKRKSEDALKLVSVGSMIWRKGYEYLLMAMKALTTTDLRYFLTIIGDGPELDRVEFCIRDLGLGDCVNLVGSASPECVRETLRESDVFVLSSLSEGISNAVLEAMACGLPVVTTDCGGMSEVVADGVEGFVVPVRDPISMSKAIRRLAVNSKLRVAMGGRGRQRVVAQYSLDGHVNSWMELLHRIDGTDRQEMNTS
jgi:glycosyltransferase involved in cell wall biosynthesis